MNLTLLNDAAGLIYWMILGTDPTSGACSYVQADGTIVACQIGDDCATYQYVLDIEAKLPFPALISARIVFTRNVPLQIAIVKDGNGNPAVQDAVFFLPSDPNYLVAYDKVEYSLVGGQVWANNTNVDFFALPTTIEIADRSGNTQNTSPLSVTRNELFAAFAATPGFECLAVTDGDANVRIVAPGYAPDFDPNYFDSYVALCWKKYASVPLDLSLAGAPAGFTSAMGMVDGEGVFQFVDNLGNAYKITMPSSSDVLLCNGVFNIDDSLPPLAQQVDGIVKRQVGAALNRSVLNDDAGAFCTLGGFYQQPVTNRYSALLHDGFQGGLCYGFAYDDVCNKFSSTLSLPDFDSMVVTVGFNPIC